MLRKCYPRKLLAISIEVSLNCIAATVALCGGAAGKHSDLHCKSYKIKLLELGQTMNNIDISLNGLALTYLSNIF